MIKYIKKLISGYSTEKKNFRGLTYRFRFRGKPIFFDPVQMLLEFHHRRNSVDVFRSALTEDLSFIRSILPQCSQDLLPSVTCTGPLGNSMLEVDRFTFKKGLQPVSLYRFYLDGTLHGEFYRIYDYGSDTQNLMNEFAFIQGEILPPIKSSVSWDNEKNQTVFVEKFGHTQVWVWNSLISIG